MTKLTLEQAVEELRLSGASFSPEDDAELWRKNVIKGISADTAKINGDSVDMVKKPPHYSLTLQGINIECIDVIRGLGLVSNYYRASAFKYLWRADRKGDKLKDLKKAKQFIEFEIEQEEYLVKIHKDAVK